MGFNMGAVKVIKRKVRSLLVAEALLYSTSLY
jgi:hypothetical protein